MISLGEVVCHGPHVRLKSDLLALHVDGGMGRVEWGEEWLLSMRGLVSVLFVFSLLSLSSQSSYFLERSGW